MKHEHEQQEKVITLPSQEPMLQTIGRGIQAFASVELGLSFLFASLMEPAPRELSVIALDAAGQLRRLRAKPDKNFVDGQAAIPSSRKTPCMATRRSW
jgi:hypothetical protein